jgi:hypothetical protein
MISCYGLLSCSVELCDHRSFHEKQKREFSQEPAQLLVTHCTRDHHVTIFQLVGASLANPHYAWCDPDPTFHFWWRSESGLGSDFSVWYGSGSDVSLWCGSVSGSSSKWCVYPEDPLKTPLGAFSAPLWASMAPGWVSMAPLPASTVFYFENGTVSDFWLCINAPWFRLFSLMRIRIVESVSSFYKGTS